MMNRHVTGGGRRVFFALILMLVQLILAGCPGESGDPTGPSRVLVSAVPSTAEVNGPPLTISVTVLRSDNSPLPAGQSVDIIEFGCVSDEPAVGIFSGQQDDANCAQTSQVVTGNNGAVQVSFTCLREGTSTILAAPTGDQTSSGSAEVTCVPGPNGLWTIPEVTRSGTLVVGSQPITLTAKAVIEDGVTPVTVGTEIVMTVLSGDSAQVNGPTVVGTDANGDAVFSLLTTDKQGVTQVGFEFLNPRFGMGTSSEVNVRAQGNTESELVALVRRDNLVVTGVDRTVLADNEDTLVVEAELIPPVGAEFAIEGQPVTFEVINGPGKFVENDAVSFSVNTDENGKAQATFIGGGSPGTAIISVTAPDPNPESESEGDLSAGDININVKGLGFIEYVGVNPGVLFVRGGGLNETGTVSFRVLDTERQPLVGVPVQMTLPDLALAGVSLNPGSTTSDDNGVVSTTLQSGTSTGAVNVTATATLGMISLTAPSSSIPILGARPTRDAFAITCEERNIGGFINRQGNNIVISDQYACSSLLRDRFGNPVGVSQQLTYKSEGGTILGTAASVEWNTTANPTSPPDNVGRVVTQYSPEGRPPCDVDPMEDEGEPFLFFDPEFCGASLLNCPERRIDDCSFNPRDGLVTILAQTTGEEAFNDINSNGGYDEGEPFWDIGEPFLDTNDNNERDPGEPFDDLATEDEMPNQQYDGPNGVWDANTTIWTSTHVLLSGVPFSHPSDDVIDGFPADASGYAFDISNPGDVYQPGETITYTTLDNPIQIAMVWQDKNLAWLNPSTDYDVELIGDRTGLAIDKISASDPVLPGGYGFSVEYNTEELDNARDGYRTDLLGFEPGYPYVVVLRVTNVNNYNTRPTLRFTADFQTSPGRGTSLEVINDIVVQLPEPIEN